MPNPCRGQYKRFENRLDLIKKVMQNQGENEAKNLGFRNILDVTSSASELRKAFNCLSKSVIESSKSVVADGDDFFQI